MGLNKSKGNMYEFVTHTWNTVKGACPHDCSYCYMKRWGQLNPVRFDEKELKADLGTDNFIFIGSSCDMWAEDISEEWIDATINHCCKFNNKYLFQTKNPDRIRRYIKYSFVPENMVVCTTIESDIYYPEIMRKSPKPLARAMAMDELNRVVDTYVTIEPIMDFNLRNMVKMIKRCYPKQVNIGADSGNNNLPEPSKEKLLDLIFELEKFTIVHRKKNLGRLLK